jgi:hypothetical protein
MMKKIGTVFLVVMSVTAVAQNDSSVLLKEVMVTATKNKQLSLLSPYSVSAIVFNKFNNFKQEQVRKH